MTQEEYLMNQKDRLQGEDVSKERYIHENSHIGNKV